MVSVLVRRIILIISSCWFLVTGCSHQYERGDKPFPAGSWLLLNPEDYGHDIIFSALMIGSAQSDDSEFQKGQVMFALIEKKSKSWLHRLYRAGLSSTVDCQH
ncbi:hypothetical protein EOPP23_19580 [Endozoicomonas sp. OPT23]|uniref:hypothetical protein n=1 Tax=Endozoicomonas sp. OPT23 TaxID=2072845 RepID=UPI00129AB207|nr:hypothetical protein [Endozoicomonas sp. OPT23]MRI35172.1 hypothetical protein [Endozoicomonas sp. OPT23]